MPLPHRPRNGVPRFETLHHEPLRRGVQAVHAVDHLDLYAEWSELAPDRHDKLGDDGLRRGWFTPIIVDRLDQLTASQRRPRS